MGRWFLHPQLPTAGGGGGGLSAKQTDRMNNYRGIVNAYEGFQRKMTDKRAKMCEAQHTLSSLSIRAVLDVIARVRPCHWTSLLRRTHPWRDRRQACRLQHSILAMYMQSSRSKTSMKLRDLEHSAYMRTWWVLNNCIKEILNNVRNQPRENLMTRQNSYAANQRL